MTISSNIPRVPFACNGVTTDFPFPYPVFNLDDLTVIETVTLTGVETPKVTPTDWIAPETPEADGSYPLGVTLRFLVAPPSTVGLTIINDPDATQPVDLTDNGALPVDSQVERPLDRVTLIIQRVLDKINRTLRQPEGDAVQIGLLPAKVLRVSKYAGYDGNGDPVSLDAPTGTSITTAFSQTLLDDATAAAARATLEAAAQADLDIVEDAVFSLSRAVQNPIINGNMEIWQRGTTFVPAASGTYSADRWRITEISASVVSINRSTNVPTVAQAGVVFNYSLEVDVTTADAVEDAGDLVMLRQSIEGYNWRHFAQRVCTLSFWVSSPKTGIHAVSLANNALDRGFVGEYTVNAANTWEYKTVSIPASPSAGAWNYAELTGVVVGFVLFSGSTYDVTVGSWQTLGFGSMPGSANQVNVLDDTANFFRITGVKMELGSVATPIQFVPFEVELARAKRYYQKSFRYALTPAQNIGTVFGAYSYGAYRAGALNQPGPSHPFAIPFRNAPTVITYNPFAANANPRDVTGAVDLTLVSLVPEESGMIPSFTGNAASAVGNQFAAHWTADAEL